jgi:hypothetical protein
MSRENVEVVRAARPLRKGWLGARRFLADRPGHPRSASSAAPVTGGRVASASITLRRTAAKCGAVRSNLSA